MPTPVIYICAAMLFLGAVPLPYGYYTLLRLVACGVFGFAAFTAHERKNIVLPWIYGMIALLFNPVFKVHFSKGTWALLDVAAAVVLLATAGSIREHGANSRILT